MSFRITGLSPEPLLSLYGLSDAALAERGVARLRVGAEPAFPDRVEVADGPNGSTVLLLNWPHQPADTPFRASHAVFIREGAEQATDLVDHIPGALARRTISLRAFDARYMMIDADLSDGEAALTGGIERLFTDPAAAYLHAHYARRGCYAARIDRA